MTIKYHKIQQYNKLIPNYILGYWFAKKKTKEFWYLYENNFNDLLQEIAYCCLITEDKNKLRRLIQRQIYKLHKHTRQIIRPLIIENRKKKVYKKRPDYNNFCDHCGKWKQEYMRKSIISNKQICGACARQIWRKDQKRNNRASMKWDNLTTRQRILRDIKIFMMYDKGSSYSQIEQYHNFTAGNASRIFRKYGLRQKMRCNNGN